MAVTIAGTQLKKMTYGGQTVKKWVHDGVQVFSAGLTIYDNGSQPDSAKTGGIATRTGGDAKVSIGSSAITGGYTDIYVNGTQCRVTTKNPIDVTDFTKLCIDVEITSTYNNYECLLRCVNWNPVTTADLPAGNGWGAFDGEIVGVKRQTVSIDISALTGNYYPMFLSFYTNFSIYKFWLE
ncbi:MAG: hypothetical protein IJ347_05290 [Faecalibacterium sp.]|nr:hypothetical protein [Faecalibacterium sp.]